MRANRSESVAFQTVYCEKFDGLSREIGGLVHSDCDNPFGKTARTHPVRV